MYCLCGAKWCEARNMCSDAYAMGQSPLHRRWEGIGATGDLNVPEGPDPWSRWGRAVWVPEPEAVYDPVAEALVPDPFVRDLEVRARALIRAGLRRQSEPF